ncbi:SUKH-3 domain-containing protein [Glycomyces sp. TRM65418]|uniref:SUKH-3 domain-containing protein n=1 Tax=Glycomyces sp. TRM65418 TaxID=2867006 RepID=UPI001CE513B5|nr:SUKH-3 domain-containing protein [Glycomyces sp. TRM65418]MCC3761735.1 SUKH-3 domain-containing protein [Glycomyces sp. TRM65418]QZD55821.1 SUKH-3 domain-containing protein [Glycomyces sp. TRM65418]
MRFSTRVASRLESSGWAPGRAVDISTWVEEFQGQGYIMHPSGCAALKEFGGLSIDPLFKEGPNYSNDEPLELDPTLTGVGFQDELEKALGGDWCPMGEWMSHSSVLIREDGLVVATGFSWVWKLGESIEDAIAFSVLGDRPLKCLAVVDPGVKPWPPE